MRKGNNMTNETTTFELRGVYTFGIHNFEYTTRRNCDGFMTIAEISLNGVPLSDKQIQDYIYKLENPTEFALVPATKKRQYKYNRMSPEWNKTFESSTRRRACLQMK